MLKRLFDLGFSLIAAGLLAIPMLLIALAVKQSSPGPILYWSDRVGRKNTIFRMPKFRSMRCDTPVVATHLLVDPGQYLTSVGKFLRRTSLDELPQLWSIFCGDMSVVGPRPALFNQSDLITLRTVAGVHQYRPGLTGWAQVNGRDELAIPDKVVLDAEYCRRCSIGFDLYIICLTLIRVVGKNNVAH
jgi:O-antigen biosynthesis protein WbqP